MENTEPSGALTRGAEACLLAGLDALAGGQDALLAGLQRASEEIGSHYSVWVGPPGGRLALCDERGARRLLELPGSAPGRWLESIPRGPLQLLGPDTLRRDARARALSLDWGLAARCTRGAGRVWFGARQPLEVNESWTYAVMRALGLLEQLASQKTQAVRRERLAQMGEQAASVAHDLRNQLSLTRLEFEAACSSEGASLERSGAALDEALHMCRSFLNREAVSSPRAQVLAPHLHSQIEESMRLSGRHGEVRVVLRCAPQLQARFEAPLLRRYLRNLLLNALAASPRGAAVRVAAERTSAGRVLLSVEDEGHGMGRTDLKRLLHAGESRGGTGFGTSSVLDCARCMAADLDVESKPAAGTRFMLCLPGPGESPVPMAMG